MARKYEKGLKYFPHDTSASWDDKIRKLTRKYGATGYAVFYRLLECIYQNGYYIFYDTSLVFQIIDSLNIDTDDEQLVVKIINEAVRNSLFDSEMFNEQKILTSEGIQTRYFDAKKASIRYAKSKKDCIDYPYLLIKEDEDKAVEITYTPKLKLEPKIEPEAKETCGSSLEDDFICYMKEHYPYIARMEKPLLLSEYHDLCQKFGKSIVDSCIANLNNYKNIKNYRSAKATLNNWCKNEQQRHPRQSNLATTIQELRTINETRTDTGDDMPE